ncbi:WhiB family transcriptional regulator [Nocardia sp. NPDC051463]|uniref:WhiB family transcriptional regulator n=1 Tax=Nocardia sp. NPDC051463 TaxID=3154845 RepID=UPI00344E14DC
MVVDSTFWRDKALCRRQDPEVWFTPAYVRLAKEICAACPVRRQCGEAADDADVYHGVAAGFDLTRYVERQRLRKWLGRAVRAELGAPITKPCQRCGLQFETRERLRQCPNCRDLVEAAPVLDHVDQLRRAGLLLIEIAPMASITLKSLHHMLYGKGGKPPAWMARDRAERILAIPVPRAVAS